MEFLKKQKGQSLVEFAIILPILLLILIGILEFGMILNSYLTIHSASREGARLAIVGGSDIEIETLITNMYPNLDVENLTVNITPVEGMRNSGDTITVKVTYNYTGISPIIGDIITDHIILKAHTSMRIE